MLPGVKHLLYSIINIVDGVPDFWNIQLNLRRFDLVRKRKTSVEVGNTVL